MCSPPPVLGSRWVGTVARVSTTHVHAGVSSHVLSHSCTEDTCTAVAFAQFAFALESGRS
eukprot:77981-Pleurochrysis_carterae.AAC.1